MAQRDGVPIEQATQWIKDEPRPSANPVSISILLPQIEILRPLTHLLSVDALAQANAGDPDAALRSLRSIAAIADHLIQPDLIMTRIARDRALLLIVDVVNFQLHHDPGVFDDEHLTQTLAILDDHPPYASYEYENRFFDDWLQRIYTDNGSGDGHITHQGIEFIYEWVFFNSNDPVPERIRFTGPIWQLSLASRAEVRRARTDLVNSIIKAIDRPLWEWKPQPTVTRIPFETDPGLHLAHDYLPAFDAIYKSREYTEQRYGALRASIALERYRRSHGSYPDTIDELTPMLLNTLPSDRFAGEPLHCKRTADSYTLYSNGPDRDDDNASPTTKPITYRQLSHETATETDLDGDWILFPPRPRDNTDD